MSWASSWIPWTWASLWHLHEFISTPVFSEFKAPMMDKLITHVPAADVEDSFTALALTWPLWESRTHPQVRTLWSLSYSQFGENVTSLKTYPCTRILPKVASSTLTTTGTTRLSASWSWVEKPRWPRTMGLRRSWLARGIRFKFWEKGERLFERERRKERWWQRRRKRERGERVQSL